MNRSRWGFSFGVGFLAGIKWSLAWKRLGKSNVHLRRPAYVTTLRMRFQIPYYDVSPLPSRDSGREATPSGKYRCVTLRGPDS